MQRHHQCDDGCHHIGTQCDDGCHQRSPKETYYTAKRDLLHSQKRPTTVMMAAINAAIITLGANVMMECSSIIFW
jgi:hypothetical protein